MKKSHIKTIELKVKKKLNGDFLGAYNTAFKGAGLIFRDLREYIVGDSIKKIDWKASARLNEMYVKNYEEERDLKVFFLIDLSKSMDFGSEKVTKKDILLELFFMISYSTIKTRDKFGALLFDGRKYEYIDFKSGEENIIKIINLIEKFDEEKVNNFTGYETLDALKYLEKLKINNSLLFILSDKLEYEKSIFKLMGILNEVIYINIFDYFENNLSSDNFGLSLGFGNKFINIFTGNKKRQESYKVFRNNKINDFKKYLREADIDYLKIDNKTDIFRELLFYFNKKQTI